MSLVISSVSSLVALSPRLLESATRDSWLVIQHRTAAALQTTEAGRTGTISSGMPITTTSITAWRLGAQLGRNRRTLHTPSSYPAAQIGHYHQNGHEKKAVLELQLEQQPDFEAIKSSMLLQASLAARVQHINATIRCELNLSISATPHQIQPWVNMRTGHTAVNCFFLRTQIYVMRMMLREGIVVKLSDPRLTRANRIGRRKT